MDIAVREAMKSSESHKMNDSVQVDEFTIGGKEEREVEESNWNNKNIGETKWTGKL